MQLTVAVKQQLLFRGEVKISSSPTAIADN